MPHGDPMEMAQVLHPEPRRGEETWLHRDPDTDTAADEQADVDEEETAADSESWAYLFLF